MANIGQKHDRLRDDATGAATCSSIDGTRGGGFSLGGVRDDGEERSEGIHLCMCECELKDVNLSEAEMLIRGLLLYIASLR